MADKYLNVIRCDLETFDLKQLNCKFDTILIEPPLEEYSRYIFFFIFVFF